MRLLSYYDRALSLAVTPREAAAWVLAASLFLLGGCAGGQGPSSPLWGSGSREDIVLVKAARTWDLNHDGSVSCEEWREYSGRLFGRFDANRDGYLDKNEYQTMATTDALFDAVSLDYFDTSKDKRVSREEFTSSPNAAFRIGDRNKDCNLDPTELVTRAPSTAATDAAPGGAGPGAGGPGR
jgi:Ca2+-binding EF-hand superfamily protein